MTNSTSTDSAGGRRIVITGAGRGLGLGLAQHFAAAGDSVIGCARNPANSPELADVAERVLAMDVTDRDSVSAGAAALADMGAVDVVINNSGIDARALGGERETSGVLDIEPAHFLGQMEVNAVGPLLVTRSFVPLLRNGRNPLILNVSSQLGSMEVGASGGQDVGYNASKAALNMITVKSATTLATDGIAVVAVHPGWVQTDMGGSSAAISTDESAAALVSLVGELTIADSGRFLRWDGTEHPW